MKTLLSIMAFSLFAWPVYAGQATIIETETGFVVEYIGGEDDQKLTQLQIQEREQRLAEEEAEKQRKRAVNERRAAARGASQEEE